PSTVGAGADSKSEALSAGPVLDPAAAPPHTMSYLEKQQVGKMMIKNTLNRTKRELADALNDLSQAQQNAGKPGAGRCDEAIAQAIASSLETQYKAAQSMWQQVNG